MKTGSVWYGEIESRINLPQSVMEVLSTFIANAMEQDGLDDKQEWYTTLHWEFAGMAKGHFNDMCDVDFIEELQNQPERETKFIAILEDAKSEILKENEILNPDSLFEFEEIKDWGDEYKTNWEGRYLKRDDLVNVVDNIIKIINHSWTKVDYYDAPFEGFLPGGWPEE